MNVVSISDDMLGGGFYTAGDAARLLRIENRQRIYRWLGDDEISSVIRRDYVPIGKSQELSFWDLIEVRFVEHFRGQGVSLQFLRRVAQKARSEFGSPHPFALSSARFLTDRHRIFQQTAEEEGASKTLDFLSGQYEMYEAVEGVLAKNLAFDPATALAREWQPFPECPHVFVNPMHAYGAPVIGTRRVPTKAVFRSWRAEGNRKRVADWFGLERLEVDEAIEFEVRLAA